jgi:type IV pilus assembly protein PilE
MSVNSQFPFHSQRSRVCEARGFSLMELVIAMVITGILASIAIPSYNSYILKSHRTEAKSALLDLAAMEERFFSTQNVYSQIPTDLGYTGAAFPVTVGSGYYQVDIPNATFIAATAPTALSPGGTPASYSLVATPLGTQTNDLACTSFTLSSSGVQQAAGSDPNPNVDCWK